MFGKVYLIGAGPGDPELITMKAFQILKKAQVVCYDRLISKEILKYCSKKCLKIPVGKSEGHHLLPQEEINSLLIHLSKKYNPVVRLKGGDPFVFGRGLEEVEGLIENAIPFEIIPGVSSCIGVPTMAGISLTHRGLAQSFAVITGHGSEDSILSEKWQKIKGIDTLVFLMGVKNRKAIAQALIKSGYNHLTPACFVENGSSSKQKVIYSSLREISTNPPDVQSPAIFIIGHVVNLAKKKSLKFQKNQSFSLNGIC